MSQSFRRATAKKLQEIIDTAKDPTIIIEAANTLAKYLPKPKTPKRRKGTPVGPIKKEVTLQELVAAIEKRRRGQALTAEEEKRLETTNQDKLIAAMRKTI